MTWTKIIAITMLLMFMATGCAQITEFLMNQTKVTLAKYMDARLAEKFKDFDFDQDGFVSKDEAKLMMKTTMQEAFSKFAAGEDVNWLETIQMLLYGMALMFIGERGGKKLMPKVAGMLKGFKNADSA